MLNNFIKWIGLIIGFGSFPIWCRLIMCTYPNTKIDLYSVTDMLFFGISLHVSCLYELNNTKKESAAISFVSIISIVALFFYIIYTVLYMRDCQNVDSRVICIMLFSMVFSVLCHIISVRVNLERNLY